MASAPKTGLAIADTKSCQDLLAELHRRGRQKGYRPLATTLDFDLHGNEALMRITPPLEQAGPQASVAAAEITVYNITRPFAGPDHRRLAGRTEPRDSEIDSRVVFYEEQIHDHRWRPIPTAPVLHLQDPFHIENVQGFNIIGGVQVWAQSESDILNYRTVFYRYRHQLSELKRPDGQIIEPFATGPDGMKDIRFIELPNGHIGLFTRPQGPTPETGGRGKIGYVEIKTLDELDAEIIAQAPIVPGLFRDDEWGGANELHLLSNGLIGILGHIAEYSGAGKNYYPITFAFDPRTHRAWGIKIIAEADNFPSHIGTKLSALHKVIFSGGLVRNPEGDAILYAGVGDVAAGLVYLDEDPFLEYER